MVYLFLAFITLPIYQCPMSKSPRPSLRCWVSDIDMAPLVCKNALIVFHNWLQNIKWIPWHYWIFVWYLEYITITFLTIHVYTFARRYSTWQYIYIYIYVWSVRLNRLITWCYISLVRWFSQLTFNVIGSKLNMAYYMSAIGTLGVLTKSRHVFHLKNIRKICLNSRMEHMAWEDLNSHNHTTVCNVTFNLCKCADYIYIYLYI